MPRIEIPDGKSDPEVRMWKLRPEMGMGAGTLSHAVYEQSILPVRERELARMRIAQINDCAICQQWRKTAGTAEALTEDDFANVMEYRTYPGYSERERLAVEYAERFALDHTDDRRRRSSPACTPSTPTPRSSTSPCASAPGSRSAAR